MKNILFAFCLLLLPSFVRAQTVTGPDKVEIGIAQKYTIAGSVSIPANTSYYTMEYNVNVSYYSAIGNLLNGSINGSTSNPYYNTQFNIASSKTSYSQDVNITWSDLYDKLPSDIKATINFTFFDQNRYQIGTATQTALKSNVTKFYIDYPTISNNNVLDCCENIVSVSALNAANANQFFWSSPTPGVSFPNGNTGATINVKPPVSGSFVLNVTAKRSSASPLYQKSSSKTINRQARSISYQPLYPELTTSPALHYICKGVGRAMLLEDQCGIASINWVANGCTISGQGTRQPTITPLASAPVGSTVQVYAQVSFTGGCSIQTTVGEFKVFDSTTPPVPAGYFDVTPVNGTICDTDAFHVEFIQTNGFVNGTTTVSPDFIFGPGDPIHYGNTAKRITVTNINHCTGAKTSKVFYLWPPAPCTTDGNYFSKSFTISPNPSNGKFSINLDSSKKGQYSIIDLSGKKIYQNSFDGNKILIEKYNLKRGIYIIEITTKDEITRNKLFID